MTLQQKRAALAFQHVEPLSLPTADATERDEYGTMAQKLPVLIRTAGLCQALHFVKSRKKPALTRLLDHLAQQMKRTDAGISDAKSLCEKVREADLSTYVWMSREALASAEWYARLSQSELNVDRTKDPRS